MGNRNLNLLLSGQLVSQAGDSFYMLALSFLALKPQGQPPRWVRCFGRYAAGGDGRVFYGVVVDRIDRKTIIIVTDIFCGIIVALMPFLYGQGTLTFGLIICSQVLLGLNPLSSIRLLGTNFKLNGRG